MNAQTSVDAMQADYSRPAPAPAPRLAGWKLALIGLIVLALMAQSLYVVEAQPGELITGVHGMADLLSRSWPPAFATFPAQLWPVLETVDIALFGTFFGVLFSLPLAWLAARNTSPAPFVYQGARALIAVCRAVPDLVWALLFVTAVGLGPFAGSLALMIHSIGMLGRLLAETIEDMDMGPMDALASTGAGRLQVFTHAVVPTVLPSLMGITLYRLDDNIRSSLVLGFVGAGGIGFQLLTAMNLFDYKTVSLLIIITFVLVIGAERFSALLRKKVL